MATIPSRPWWQPQGAWNPPDPDWLRPRPGRRADASRAHRVRRLPAGVPAMILQGRIPGRPGTWEMSYADGRVESLSCMDPAFLDDRCRWITPGLFDLQINGISGINFTS